MDKIQIEILNDFLYGKCFLLAWNLQRRIGGEIWCISIDDYEHAILKYNEYFIDISGIYTQDELLFVFKLRYITGNKYLTINDMFRYKNLSISDSFLESVVLKKELSNDIEYGEWLDEINWLSEYIIETKEFKSKFFF